MNKAILLVVALLLISVVAFARTRGDQPNVSISPNPVKDATTITIFMPQTANVTLTIEDGQENQLHLLYEGELTAGIHNIPWDCTLEDGSRLEPGRYILHLREQRFTSIKRIIILK